MGSASSIQKSEEQEETIFTFDYNKDFYQKYSDKNAYDKLKYQLEIQKTIEQNKEKNNRTK